MKQEGENNLLEYDARSAKTIADSIKNSYRLDVYFLLPDYILQVQDYPEQYPYLIRLRDKKWSRVLKWINAPKSLL